MPLFGEFSRSGYACQSTILYQSILMMLKPCVIKEIGLLHSSLQHVFEEVLNDNDDSELITAVVLFSNPYSQLQDKDPTRKIESISMECFPTV
jgi:hypothetical protein